MAWFGRGERAKSPLFDDRPNLAAEPTREEKIVAEPAADLAAHFFKGSRVTGKLLVIGAAEIDGNVSGDILCRGGTLSIGDGAEIRGNIAGDVIVIRGSVEGDVAAKEKVELDRPAQLTGNIAAPRLVISEGVVFDGDCAMDSAKKRREVPVAPDSEGESPEPVTVEK
ncbi:MAG TPA: polymer-forming cytoskeletal protein [Candidatus Binatia bacterium]|nr:polymer-forming cytoskeletal protein [Candidatus Binatia bacterium]